MERYLYGAAVQGIQGFIFQTNKLREIVGASELVEEICTTLFEEVVGRNEYHEYDDVLQSGAVMQAAGNVKYIFSSKEACEKTVREFPSKVAKKAPGVTVSQAVVPFDGDFESSVNILESYLRQQRNLPMRSSMLGLMGILRSRQTGLPVVEIRNVNHYGKTEELFLDEGTKAKYKKETIQTLCYKSFGREFHSERIPRDIEDITNTNDWIAIVHIDGNGLGQVVQKVGKKPKEFKQFSSLLDEATVEAAHDTFDFIDKEWGLSSTNGVIPIRPIVLSGDDYTFICRGDIAIEYVNKFMECFEHSTQDKLGDIIIENDVFTEGDVKDKLTSCAGIAFIKSSFPFYYGYDLAETLCEQAKKDAKSRIVQGKELPKSCLMFHKVQDSFTEEWDAIKARELTPYKNISYQFGPYYLHPDNERWDVAKLLQKVKMLGYEGKEESALKSRLRNWMALQHQNPQLADQDRRRILTRYTGKTRELAVELTEPVNRNGESCYPVYDILAINTINNQVTK